MKPILTLLIAMLCFSSCKKDSTVNKSTKRINNIKVTRPNHIENYHFSYYDNGLIKHLYYIDSLIIGEDVSVSSFQAFYNTNDNNTITSAHFLNTQSNSSTIDSEAFFDHDSNNKLKTATYVYNGDTSLTTYTWTGNNISKIASTTPHLSDSVYISTLQYDANNNVSTISRSIQGTTFSTTLYNNIEYDGTPNYITQIKGFEYIHSFFRVEPQTFSSNNVLKETYRYSASVQDNRSYSISYNSSNEISSQKMNILPIFVTQVKYAFY